MNNNKFLLYQYYYYIYYIHLSTGVAWLSAVRVVKCLVSFYNGRDPWNYLPLIIFYGYGYNLTALIEREEGKDEVKSAWP